RIVLGATAGLTFPHHIYDEMTGDVTTLVSSSHWGLGVTAGSSISGTAVTGAWRLSTAVAANSYARMMNGRADGSMANIYPSGGVAWGMAARFRVPTSITATSLVQIGSLDATQNNGFWAGIYGATSTTKFACQGVVSTVSIDTQWHDLYMVSHGTTQYCSFDNETKIAPGAGAPATAHGPFIDVNNLANGGSL